MPSIYFFFDRINKQKNHDVIKETIKKIFLNAEIEYHDHHLSHAASAFSIQLLLNLI